MKAEEFISQYEAALASQDWTLVKPLIHSDAIVLFSDGSVHEGIDNIQIAFERNFEMIKSEKYQVLNVKWLRGEENKAKYLFDFEWQGFINGQLMSGSGKGECELKKVGDVWLMWREILKK